MRGARIRSARAVALSGDDIHAHNSFEHPDAVVPRTVEPVAAAGRLVCSFPPASVVRVIGDLA